MMRSSTIRNLALGAVAACGLAAYALYDESAPVKGKNIDGIGEKILPELDNRFNDIHQVSITNAGQSYAVKFDGTDWVMLDPEGFPAKSGEVRDLAIGLNSLLKYEPKTADAGRYAKLQVEDPAGKDAKSTLVAFKDKEGKVIAQLIVGSFEQFASGGKKASVYVRRPDDARAWLVRGPLTINRDKLEWMDVEFTTLPREKVKQVDVFNTDGTKVTLTKDKPETEDFTLLDIPADRKAGPKFATNGLAGALAFPSVQDAKKRTEVDFTGALTARFESFDGLVQNIQLIQHDSDTFLAVDAEARADATPEVKAKVDEINRKLQTWAIKVPGYRYSDIGRKMSDLTEALPPPPPAVAGLGASDAAVSAIGDGASGAAIGAGASPAAIVGITATPAVIPAAGASVTSPVLKTKP